MRGLPKDLNITMYSTPTLLCTESTSVVCTYVEPKLETCDLRRALEPWEPLCPCPSGDPGGCFSAKDRQVLERSPAYSTNIMFIQQEQ